MAGKSVPFTSSFEVADKDKRVKRYGALAVSLFGVESWKEPVFAFLVHVACWMNEGQGPSCMYSALSGLHLQKGRWLYAGVPIAVNLSDLDMPKNTQMAHGASFALGYVAAHLRWV